MIKGQISHETLAKKLAAGEFKFRFERLDGARRDVRGTTNLDLIPKENHPKGGQGPTGTIFFDLEIECWRCVSYDSKIFIN